MSSVSKSFPDFLVLGAPKAGTTALCEFLQGHPSVSVAKSKELRYFDKHYDRGQGWYREKFFPANEGFLCGDGSPTYLADPEALKRIPACLCSGTGCVLGTGAVDGVATVICFGWLGRRLGRIGDDGSRSLSTFL